MATRRPYRTLDLAMKVKIMKEVEEGGIVKKDIARRYGIKPNTLSNFMKNKHSILEAVEKEQFKMSRKRMRTGAHPELEQVLLIWIREARSNHPPLSGDIVAAKALSLAAMLGIENFASSDGWLTRFKQCHDLVFKSVLYRKHLLEWMLLCMDSSTQYEVSLLSAIQMLARAWARVKEETTANCFRACGFSASVAGVGSSSPAGEADTSELDDNTLETALGDVPFEEYVVIDSSVETCGALTDTEIIEIIQSNEAANESDEDDDISSEPQPAADVAAGLALTQRFFAAESNANEALGHVYSLQNLLSVARCRKQKQTA
ncbi:hypothetical protein HPB49_008196 [Dermacentor silvarum]|uniref:Uncharacterized protein n=1 Tax=Dermacentor silvarum TaxID=543639 RepID=A0ACB8DXJ2_DERSI|nr:hypothetical protein HPB49_008196 [Dermacentor silvarum]